MVPRVSYERRDRGPSWRDKIYAGVFPGPVDHPWDAQGSDEDRVALDLEPLARELHLARRKPVLRKHLLESLVLAVTQDLPDWNLPGQPMRHEQVVPLDEIPGVSIFRDAETDCAAQRRPFRRRVEVEEPICIGRKDGVSSSDMIPELAAMRVTYLR